MLKYDYPVDINSMKRQSSLRIKLEESNKMKAINVMIVGLPGNMSSLIAKGIVESGDMVLNPIGLSHTVNKDAESGFAVELVSCEEHKRAIMENDPNIIVDFSKGSPERNCELFCNCGVPFVMGSTGGDREAMKKMVESSNISAVIAPNMASPVIAIQAMLEYAARNFPGVFSEYSLEITESHQEMKADTSGTAIAFEKLFSKMGAVSDKDGILSIRNSLIQERLYEVPEEHLGGHGYHKYTLISGDGTVRVGLVHNIDGRSAYVDGTLQAIRFLAKESNKSGKVFSMTDVLRA